ncbi:hypothetical protein D3C78_1519360 [compost metagenome]
MSEPTPAQAKLEVGTSATVAAVIDLKFTIPLRIVMASSSEVARKNTHVTLTNRKVTSQAKGLGIDIPICFHRR